MIFSVRMPKTGPIALAVLAAWGGAAHAVGLGSIRVQSALGQPLHVSISLIGADSADLSPSCLRAKIESADGAFITAPAIAVLRAPGSNAIILTTRQSINEPVVAVAVDVSCGPQVHRDFQILLDPVDTLPSVAAAGSPSAAPEQTALSAKPRRRATAPQSDVTRVPRTRERASKSRDAGAMRTDSALKAPVAPATAAPAKNVLKLSGEALTPEDLKALGHLRLSGSLAQPPASASAPATATQQEDLIAARNRFAMVLRGEDPVLSAEKNRLVEQTEIAQLRQQTVSIAQQRAADQVALEELRRRTLPFGWIVGLAALLLASLAAVGWLAWRLATVRRGHDTALWDSAAVPLDSREHGNDAAHGIAAAAAAKSSGTGLFANGRKAPSNLASVPEFLRVGGAGDDDRTERLPLPVAAVSPAAAAAAEATAAAHREALQFYPAKVDNLKVEEISDVMQEAEFWMSLNDPQRAIEILEPYSNVEQPDSPIPWLYLLDLYRGTGEKTKYDALQLRTQRLFNARIPTWDEDGDITDGRTLEDYPHVVERICEYWETNHILVYLESLIFDDREGIRAGFDLAVYQEVMLLMAMAREITAMHSTTASGGNVPSPITTE